MKTNLFLCLLSSILIVGCNSSDDSYLIEFDVNKNYPVYDIKLSDVAEVKYIELKGLNTFWVNNDISAKILVCEDFILIGDRNSVESKLVLFDADGNFIRIIGTYGRGPGEFLEQFTFVVDTSAQKIIVHSIDQKLFIKFDFTGNMIDYHQINERFYQTAFINNQVIGYNYRSRYFSYISNTVKGSGVSLHAYDIGKFKPLSIGDIKYDRPYNGKIGLINNLTKVKDGCYITSFQSDTIYFVDSSLRIYPRFVNKRYSDDINISIFPVLEAEDYILFSTESEMNVECKRDMFMLRKRDNKIFRLSNNNSYALNYKAKLLNNELALNQFTLTQNHNIAAVLLPYELLQKNYSILTNDLKNIVDKMTDNSNPILVLITARTGSISCIN
ncbi:MAG: 6-bladed beta-propeller [Candidatus Margulisbacteria bacterium]|nr:6-bladed beta-propeller [Candidatus Margulisiibacteriota bacterium]